ncbi:YcaO-like family protein [Kitasatospora sp. NPDC047058]|uniref:YcaO-like family protein n=1 Tax=Kitasatospora sp. NPDC047058 TaxID=3155620 RepID=UPI0033E486C8
MAVLTIAEPSTVWQEFADLHGARPSVSDGWDTEAERAAWTAARDAGVPLLSVRVFPDEVQIGPLWDPAGPAPSCAGCAEARERLAAPIAHGHPIVREWRARRSGTGASPLLPLLARAALAAGTPLAPGELLSVRPGGLRRHRITRYHACPVCGDAGMPHDRTDAPPVRTPEPLVLADRPSPSPLPLRERPGLPMPADELHRRTVDARFGPFVGVQRETQAPFAMSNAVMPGGPVGSGHGRGVTYRESDPVAILEMYERIGGFPYGTGRVVRDLPYQGIGLPALDPAALGGHTARQLAHPSCRVLPYAPDAPTDWVWGHRIPTGEPVLVPAEVGFYQYRLEREGDKKIHFLESSSGCALGASLEEAALHALFEVTERDAFLLAWHRRRPLPAIDPASVRRERSRELIGLIRSRGYDVHLLAASQDIPLPSVWVLAVHRDGLFPASYSAAGTHPDPEAAVEAGLWELAQLVHERVPFDPAAVERMITDPFEVRVLDDHYQLYKRPELLPRVTEVLGGPVVRLDEAFPGWPDALRPAAGAQPDVRASLETVLGLYADAGLDTAIVVDQSTRDHRDLGLAAAKVIVPGTLPMTFGHANQRLLGLTRLTDGLLVDGRPVTADDLPLDPHPFP